MSPPRRDREDDGMTESPQDQGKPQDAPHWPTPAEPPSPWPDPPAAVTPIGSNAGVAQLPPAQTHTWTVMSSAKRTGWWRVPERFGTSVAMGEMRLDLREAELSGPVTTIEVHGLLGEVKIIVPDTCRVECTGSPILGDFESKDVDAAPDPGPAAPLIRVTGSMLLGSVTVYRTAAAVGQGAYVIDGLKGARSRRERRRRELGR